MTMENMGELPADQQINGDSSNGTATQSQPSPQPEQDYASSQEELETSITRSEAIPVSVSSMIDSSEFRSQMGDVTYHTLNGRMSPSYSPNNYATLTPLQPLPPISTVSDKFSHVTGPNVSGGFTLMPQNNGLAPGIMDMTTYGHRYDKLGMPGVSMSMNVGPTLGATAMTMMSGNNLNYQQSLGTYGYHHAQNGLASPKAEPKMASPNSYVDSYAASPMRIDHNATRLHSPNSMMVSMNGLHTAPTPSPHSESPQRERPGTSLDLQNACKPQQQEIEEINTKELAQRISSELKRYSIPQAVFAQRVLCRSQGTLSDLLRNPKPWSKLKSGRETFRRMWKWLQEPEFQRMSALRLAGSLSSVARTHNICTSTFLPDSSLGAPNTPVIKEELDEPVHHPCHMSYDATYDTRGHALFPTAFQGSAFKPSQSPTKAGYVGQQGYITEACKRKELDVDKSPEENRPPKKPRLVFTDIQRRTLHAIFKETKRPSKEMQQTIAQQLGLEVTTVANFFMNARRRSLDKWQDDNGNNTRESVAGCNKS